MRPLLAALTPLIALALVPATARADVGGSIFTIAGAGASHVIADGERATSAGFDGVARVAVLPDGDVLVTSYEQVWRIHDGVAHAVAGTGEVGATGDGVPAREATLDLSFQVAADPAGGFVLTDGETRVRRVTPDGRIFTVAGNGKTPGRLPDLHGQPATSVPIDALTSRPGRTAAC